MRRLLLLAFVALSSALASPGVETEAVADGVRVPVLVELFSSEGCSSCPPADRFLSRLDRDQPVAGAEVIALELHVDYWNQLGWTDPFSQATFTSRQRTHVYMMNTGRIYTPQLVIDGRFELTGSNVTGATQDVQQAAHFPHVSVKLRRTGDTLSIETAAAPQSEGVTQVMLATTERGLHTTVTAGENSGSTLVHGPIVRTLRYVADLGATGYTGQVQQPMKAGTRVVALVEGRDNLHILGAATID